MHISKTCHIISTLVHEQEFILLVYAGLSTKDILGVQEGGGGQIGVLMSKHNPLEFQNTCRLFMCKSTFTSFTAYFYPVNKKYAKRYCYFYFVVYVMSLRL